jgi:plasmid stability protein
MSSITLHNLSDSLYALLKQRARREGKSLNRTAQELLTESVGLEKKAAKSGKMKDVYAELCGVMSREELKIMRKAEKDFEVIEEKDWE